jgi:acetyl esterase/lipase
MLTERALRAVARRAIQLLDEQGFRQGKRGPGLCVGDAIAEADPKKKYRWALWARAESVICATTRMCHGTGKRLIPRWNDKPGRTKAEAIELLRRVAAHDVPFTYRDCWGLVHS